MISTRSVGLVIDTVVCLTLVKWETVSGQFGGHLIIGAKADTYRRALIFSIVVAVLVAAAFVVWFRSIFPYDGTKGQQLDFVLSDESQNVIQWFVRTSQKIVIAGGAASVGYWAKRILQWANSDYRPNLERFRLRRQFGSYSWQAVAGIILLIGLVALWRLPWLSEQYIWFAHVRNYVLTPTRERALQPGESFLECAESEKGYSKYCPTMIVVPEGRFGMGSPDGAEGRSGDEGPQHEVTIATSFAVSKFEVTFDHWDACLQSGGCTSRGGGIYGRGKQPAMVMTWDEAQEYVRWLAAPVYP